MKHAVAVCAHGTKVRDWIDQVLLIDVRDLIQVMHLNVTRTKGTVLFLETEPANGAFVSMVRDACLTSGGASVISVNGNKLTFSLGVPLDLRPTGWLKIKCLFAMYEGKDLIRNSVGNR